MGESEKNTRTNIDKNLDLLRTLYAISYILGYRILGEKFPIEFADYSRGDYFFVTASVALMFLSMRLFWGVNNIRRHLHEVIKFNAEGRITNLWRVRETMLVHVPILLAHSFIFYLLCRIVGDFSLGLNSYVDGSETLVWRFICLYLLLLVVNTVWLFALKTKGRRDAPENVWMWNNGLTAIALTSVLIGDYFFDLFSPGSHGLLISSLILFFVNSFADYYFAAKTYLVD